MGKRPIAYILDIAANRVEAVAGAEMRALRAQGHRVQAITLRHTPDEVQAAKRSPNDDILSIDQTDAGRVSLEILRLYRRSATARRGLSFLRAQLSLSRCPLLWNAAKLAAAAQAAGCRHLHAHGAGEAAAHALVAARMIGASVSFTCRGDDVYGTPSDLREMLRATDFAVAQCRDMAADLMELVPAARIVTIPRGVEPDRFTPRPEGTPDNGRYLFVGRLVEQAGLGDLLDALGMIPASRRPALDVVGAGPDAAALRERAAARGLTEEVRFLDARSESWMAAEGPRYRALVGPFKAAHTGERDADPLPVKEAMAMGLPVIASRFMGIKDTVMMGTGILFEPGDVLGLAAALLALEGMPPAQRRAMGKAGRACVLDRFPAARQAEALSRMIEGA